MLESVYFGHDSLFLREDAFGGMAVAFRTSFKSSFLMPRHLSHVRLTIEGDESDSLTNSITAFSRPWRQVLFFRILRVSTTTPTIPTNRPALKVDVDIRIK